MILRKEKYIFSVKGIDWLSCRMTTTEFVKMRFPCLAPFIAFARDLYTRSATQIFEEYEYEKYYITEHLLYHFVMLTLHDYNLNPMTLFNHN